MIELLFQRSYEIVLPRMTSAQIHDLQETEKSDRTDSARSAATKAIFRPIRWAWNPLVSAQMGNASILIITLYGW